MKISIVVSMVVLGISVHSMALAHGQDGHTHTPLDAKQEARIKFEERKELVKDKVEQKRVELRSFLQSNPSNGTKLNTQAQARVLTLTEAVLIRFEAVALRYDGFSTRIQSRIDKLTEQGVDTTTVRAHHQGARAQLDDLVASISAAQAEITALVEGISSKDAIKDVISRLKESVSSTHEAFIQTVTALRVSAPLETELVL